MMVPLRRNQDS